MVSNALLPGGIADSSWKGKESFQCLRKFLSEPRSTRSLLFPLTLSHVPEKTCETERAESILIERWDCYIPEVSPCMGIDEKEHSVVSSLVHNTR